MSRSQIADAPGLGGGGDPLGRWLRGVPAPAWTRRPRAKDDLRETAVAMRKAPKSQFGKCTIKTHKPKTVRTNVGTEYHGCLLVYVRNSATLNLQIDGWCEGLAAAAEALDAG